MTKIDEIKPKSALKVQVFRESTFAIMSTLKFLGGLINLHASTFLHRLSIKSILIIVLLFGYAEAGADIIRAAPGRVRRNLKKNIKHGGEGTTEGGMKYAE